MSWFFFQIIFGWFYGHLAEWCIHKYILHQFGTKRKSIWSFHFREHHAVCRRRNNRDDGYLCKKFTLKWNRAGKETIGLILLGAIHTPLLAFVPYFVIMVWASIVSYYYYHKKSHTDVEWGKKNLPWHYDHHMGKDQHINWGVRSDMFDRLFGTRKKF